MQSITLLFRFVLAIIIHIITCFIIIVSEQSPNARLRPVLPFVFIVLMLSNFNNFNEKEFTLMILCKQACNADALEIQHKYLKPL